MENGEWKVESGKWRMESGEWKVESLQFLKIDYQHYTQHIESKI